MGPGPRFGAVGVEGFLREYWQREALLLRQAFAGFESPLNADELAGLALEEEVESRLVVERGADGPWQLQHGPFTAEELSSLPGRGWTLLVQAVDQWVPAAAALRRRFDFLPGWRLDDLMFSFAPPGGGVGPHFDHYDVFLLQASGRRRWRIGQRCDDSTPLRDDTALSILTEFRQREEHLLEPGDMLYLPPGLAHWGIAEDDCITISVGFRAPSAVELLGALADQVAGRLPDSLRYRDPLGAAPTRPGELPEATLDAVRDLLAPLIADRAVLAEAFGALVTERRYPAEHGTSDLDADGLLSALRAGAGLERHPAARWAWFRHDAQARLFVDGQGLDCPQPLARRLADEASSLTLAWFEALGAVDRERVAELLAAGALRLRD